MKCVCKTCKANFNVEYNIDNIVDMNYCQQCIVDKENKNKGCYKCNKCSDNTRLCDDCIEKSGCVKCEKIIIGIVMIPFIPLLVIPYSYKAIRNKCLGRHWSEGIIY